MKVSRFVFAACFMFLIALGSALAEKFTLVLLPDTQYYLDDNYKDRKTYLKQTVWIADHAEALNIKFVAHMGDVTNGSDRAMWAGAVEAHNVLHTAGIPFNVVLGNHDYDNDDINGRKTSNYSAAFSGFAPPWYDGQMGDGIDNTYTVFSAEGLDFLVVSLEYAPTKDALCWADEVIANHPTHRVIVVTHGYMGGGGNRRALDEYAIGSDGWNLWDELVQRHSNIFMVLCGHTNDSEHRQRLGLAGNVIHEILTDFQYEGPKGNEPIRYGNGWLRLLEFDPEENKINISTKSVEEWDPDIFDVPGSPEFYNSSYSSDPSAEDHQFSLDYDMTSVMPAYVNTPNDAHFNSRTVNLVRGGQQKNPAIAMDENGNFVVVWADDNDNNGSYDIDGSGFYSGGSRRFGTIPINSGLTGGQQNNPAIAMDAEGNFVVVWADDNDNNDSYDIRGSGFDSDGRKQFGPIVINSGLTGGQQNSPAIAMDAEGNFVVVWQDDNDNNDYYDIRGSGFGSDGSKQFGPIVINSGLTGGQQLDPAIAMDAEGNFVVVWEDDNDKNGSYDIRGSGFDSDGSLQYGPIVINSDLTGGQQNNPAIAMDENGNFVVVWADDNDNNDSYDIRGSGFDSDGSKQFGPIVINSGLTGGQQNRPAIAMDAEGNFVVVWQDDNDNNDYYDIRGSGFDSDGSKQFDATRINSTATGGQQKLPAIAMNPNGGFVTAWEDDCDKNGYTDIVARGIRNYNLTVVGNGGGTVNSGALSGPSGSQIAISAQPDNGMRFSHWTSGAEDPSAASTYVFMDGNRTVTAWFVTMDVTPPEFTIDILPNPVLPFELDLYFYPSELLNGVPEVTIAGQAGSVSQTVTQLSNRDAACYLTDYRVGQSGSYTIAVCGTDPSANRGCKDENFSASQIFVNSGVELESPTGAIRLCIPAGWARDNGLVVYKERTIGPSDLALLNIPIYVTPILVVDLTATVANSNKPFLLTVDVRALDFSVGDGRTVVLVPIGHMPSRLIPTRMNVSTGEYLAEVSDLGPYVIGTADIDKLEVLPSAYRLEQNSPNPFNGWTKIPFSTGEQAHVTIDVFNVLGQKITTLADRDLPAGDYSISWDGRTDTGKECASGIYFYRLTAGSHVETKKMLYLK